MEENKDLNEQSLKEISNASEVASKPENKPEKKKKKVGKILGIIAGAIALVVAVVIIFSVLSNNKNFTRGKFINEIGGTSETFVGVVSKRSYDSAERAAEEYLYNELRGGSNVTLNNVTNLGESSASEHNIPQELLEGSDLVEKLEVEYSRSSYSTASYSLQTVSSSDEGTREKVVVFVIRYGTQWRYYTPMPIKGEALNESYFTSVFESEKYRNCTLEIIETNKTGLFGISLAKSSIKWVIKIQDNRLYFEQTVSEGSGKDDTVTAWYLEDNGYGEVKLYEKVGDGDWIYTPGYTIGFYNGHYIIRNLDDYTPFFDQLHFEPDLFNKTDYGFEVSEDNGREYFLDTLFWRELTDVLRAQDIAYVRDEDVTVKKMYAEFFVQEGALTGARMNSNVSFKIDVEGIEITCNSACEYTAKITDYGTTVVENPIQ